jgi:RNA polymerase sigma-70 factor (family 1)
MIKELPIGDFSSLEEAFRLYNRPLLFFVKNMLKDSKVSEEIVSDSFVKLWQHRHNIQTGENLKAFLYIVTKNACRNYLKSSYSKQNFEYELDEDLMISEPDVYVKILNAELMESISYEMAKLPEKQRLVFKMSYLDGLSTIEICEKLNVSESAVFANKSRALEALRKAFKDKNMLLALFVLNALIK